MSGSNTQVCTSVCSPSHFVFVTRTRTPTSLQTHTHVRACTHDVETWAPRMKAIAAIADQDPESKVKPGVLALQEVTQPQLDMLRTSLACAGYTSQCVQSEGRQDYFCMLAVRAPMGPLVDARTFAFQSCSSMMGRELLLGRTQWPGLCVCV